MSGRRTSTVQDAMRVVYLPFPVTCPDERYSRRPRQTLLADPGEARPTPCMLKVGQRSRSEEGDIEANRAIQVNAVLDKGINSRLEWPP
ncbi:hypothetical protein BAUCODRAFT_119035 [Baudoinia panamericana UAMH 10762]|uniref:Uncharacterized protein n=1 Tax=Baudoinia panamericana (strain UAMH 10762) TaxID=717646 RepID=M2MRJ4_BAUPA|nr:uncharacterized protein BAUCODRAFT_119035 [Baudoinia panamericana UAMH 10762]EMC99451.1 hypothetical protein BAUCODRAFT_119035 [Baudoinia panamericana UAMH 10762]